MARILRNNSKIIARRFEDGPCFFPSFCNGLGIPWINSVGLAPVSAELFRMLVEMWPMLEVFGFKIVNPCRFVVFQRCNRFADFTGREWLFHFAWFNF